MSNRDGVQYWLSRSIRGLKLLHVESDSPVSLAAIQALRKPLSGLNFAKVPAVKFVFGRGEPDCPFATKVNGPVFRPKGRPWPVDVEGSLKAFFMQFNFDDTTTFEQTLPGNVLQVYATAVPPIWSDRNFISWSPDYHNCGFTFEWIHSSDPDLVRHEDGSQGATFPNCFGIGVPTHDFVAYDEVIEKLRAPFHRILPTNPHQARDFLAAAARVRATKIGGLPCRLGELPALRSGQLLCTFHGVSLAHDCAYPWANQAKKIPLREILSAENHVLFGDGHLMEVFIDSDGDVFCDTDLSD